MLSEDIRSALAIISLGLVFFGFWYGMIFFGPPAIACAVLALYTAPEEKVIETPYKVCAFIGLALGVLETVGGILVLTGVVVPG